MSKKNRISTIFITLLSFVASLTIFSYLEVQNAASGRVFENPEYLAFNRVALVLGTSDLTRSGNPSPFFRSRILGAARLYHEHRINYILASGDNARKSYNEPIKMKAALVAEGVPPDRVFLDYAGFSTLDSVFRAKKVFGLESYIVVTQEFQAQRAIYLARSAGMDVAAYAVDDVPGALGVNMEIREVFARLKAFLDLFVFGTQPVYLGKPEVIQ